MGAVVTTLIRVAAGALACLGYGITVLGVAIGVLGACIVDFAEGKK